MAERKGRALRAWVPVLALALAWAFPVPRLRADLTLAAVPAPEGITPSGAAVSVSGEPVAVSGAAQASPTGLEPVPASPAAVAPVPSSDTVSGTEAALSGSPEALDLSLYLGGGASLVLDPLPGMGGAPRFSVGAAAADAGFGARWRSTEKMLELNKGGGVQARLVLGADLAVVRGGLLRLRQPLELVAGAPALDRDGLVALLQSLGAPHIGAPSAEAPPASVRAPLTPLSAPSTGPEGAGAYVPAPTPVLAEAVPTAHAAARPLTGARIRTIVVDAGHGGKDPGARGPDGLREKDVCLDIALRLRRELNRRDPSLRVVLTRDGDYFVTLLGRTRIANRAKGDLFVSIHNNASPDPRTHGTQVFFYDSQSSDRAAADLSQRENGEANQLDILMTDLAKSIVRDQSIGFASLVQRALGSAIHLKRRSVSYAPFYVLARTEMPAILVEVAFITNPHEEALLGSPDFRQRVAASLATGIENYAALVSAKR